MVYESGNWHTVHKSRLGHLEISVFETTRKCRQSESPIKQKSPSFLTVFLNRKPKLNFEIFLFLWVIGTLDNKSALENSNLKWA